MPKLICIFIVHIWHQHVFSRCSLYNFGNSDIRSSLQYNSHLHSVCSSAKLSGTYWALSAVSLDDLDSFLILGRSFTSELISSVDFETGMDKLSKLHQSWSLNKGQWFLVRHRFAMCTRSGSSLIAPWNISENSVIKLQNSLQRISLDHAKRMFMSHKLYTQIGRTIWLPATTDTIEHNMKEKALYQIHIYS